MLPPLHRVPPRRNHKYRLKFRGYTYSNIFLYWSAYDYKNVAASISNKTCAVDLKAPATMEDEALLLTELRHLVLDRCLDFALMNTSVAEPSSDDIGIFDGVDYDGDDGGSEDIVFCPLIVLQSIKRSNSRDML